MNAPSVTEAAKTAIAEIRLRLEPYGAVDGPFEAFKAGHMPEKGPFWYSATVFNGLSEAEIGELESQLPYPVPEQTQARIPSTMREFLAVSNGLHCHNLSIYGMYWRIEHAVGAPIGLHYGQIERAQNIPRTWFGFGSMNGPWASQGTLYLTDHEEVVLAHRDTGNIGARWPSLSEFLQTEIPRLLGIHDAKGDVLPGTSKLPGNTRDWEAKAELAKLKAAGWRGYLKRAARWLRHLLRTTGARD